MVQGPGRDEMCVFPGDAGGAIARPFALCVDSAQPVAAARWWHDVWAGTSATAPTARHATSIGGMVLKFVPVDDRRESQ